MVFPNHDLIGKGTVTKKYIENGEYYVGCGIWLEDEKGKLHEQESLCGQLDGEYYRADTAG